MFLGGLGAIVMGLIPLEFPLEASAGQLVNAWEESRLASRW